MKKNQIMTILVFLLVINVLCTAAEQYSLNAGDSVSFDGKNIKLLKCSADTAVVEVDGSILTISNNNNKTSKGLRIKVDSIFNDETTQFDSARLTINTLSSEITPPPQEIISSQEIVVEKFSANCIDSDNGKNYKIKGEVTVLITKNYENTKTDYCRDNATLFEYSCKSKEEYSMTSHKCPYKCEDGKCIILPEKSKEPDIPIITPSKPEVKQEESPKKPESKPQETVLKMPENKTIIQEVQAPKYANKTQQPANDNLSVKLGIWIKQILRGK